MAKKVKLKDRNNNQILPITRATTVEMNDGTNMQEKLDSIEDNILEVNYNSTTTALVFGSSGKYTITLTGNGVSDIYDILVNGESKTTSDFPMEVDEGSSLGFEHGRVGIACTVTMGGTDITSSVQTEQSTVSGWEVLEYLLYNITNITGDIVVTINNNSGGAGN